MELFVLLIAVFFVGSIIGGLIIGLIAGGETEGENFWRNQYFMEKDSHSGTKKLLDEYRLKERGVIWQTLHNTVISGIASTLNH